MLTEKEIGVLKEAFKPSSRTEGWCDEDGNRINPTHWTELPSPPNKQE